MKKVLIQVATEFHYMVAFSLIEQYYDLSTHEIHFIVAKGQASRLSNLTFDERFNYHITRYEHTKKEVSNDVVELMEFIKANDFYHFISFLYHDPLFVYLTYYFKNKNTVSYLAPDGMGAYVKFTKSNLRSRIVNSLAAYSFFKRHNLKFNKLWLTSWDFGKNGYYDYIYAYSKTLPNLPNKKIVEVDYTLSEKNIESLKKTFSVDFSAYPDLSKVVLVINDRHSLPKYESRLLKTISDKMPGYKILFKKHPNQKAENLTYIDDSVYRIDEIFPVELLIASIKDGVIISSYSNSMLYHNNNCHYFWTYPIIAKSGELKKDIKRYNPKDYIKVVQNFEELEDSLSKIANANK